MSTNLITIPMGKIYYDPDGNGEVLLGQTRNGQLRVSQSKETVMDTDNPNGGPILDIPYNVTREVSFEVAELSDLAVALFTRTTESTHTQASGSVTGETVPWTVGRIVQLGQSSANPAGNRGISSLVLSQGIVGGNPYHVASSAYSLDADLGRLTILTDSGGQSGQAVVAAYTKAAQTWTHHEEDPSIPPIIGAIRFVANNAAGPNRDVYIPNVTLAADGEMTLKGDAQQKATTLAFKGLLMRIGSTPALFIDGRAA